jgi:hypothetical protein
MITYQITVSGLLIADPYALCSSLFDNYSEHRGLSFDPSGVITIQFDSEQSHSDLGPLVKVEKIDG